MKHTMTPAEEDEWATRMIGGPKPTTPRPKSFAAVTRKRAYTVEELWEKWSVFQSKYPNVRDGAEFLLFLEK